MKPDRKAVNGSPWWLSDEWDLPGGVTLRRSYDPAGTLAPVHTVRRGGVELAVIGEVFDVLLKVREGLCDPVRQETGTAHP